jgi:vacuolar-type H+-ATPase subunit E/Vma4
VSQFEDYDKVAKSLLRDAVGHLDNVASLVVLADPVTRETLTSTVLARLGEELSCELSLGDPLREGVGVIVQSADGHVSYDNTLQQRLARQRSALRAEVFAILSGRDV